MIIHPMSQTTAGVWIIEDHIAVVARDDYEKSSDLIVSMLALSRSGIRHPDNWNGIFEPVLKAANVKSWTTFAKGSRCVQIDQIDAAISFLPTKNMGSREGFVPIMEEIIAVNENARDLHGSLLKAFDASS